MDTIESLAILFAPQYVDEEQSDSYPMILAKKTFELNFEEILYSPDHSINSDAI
jgi:hypothetical protein